MTETPRDIARKLARKYGVLSTEGLDKLTSILQPLRVRRGTKVLKEGDVCKHIYYVERGLVRQFYTKEGKQLTEHIAYEGGVVMCIESLFRAVPSQLTIETLEPSMFYAIPFEPFRELTRQRYEYCELLFNIMQESLIISQHKADTLRFEAARERYLHTLETQPDIIRRTPLHIVANYLRMTPETLSRVRSALNAESR